jgi:hypothetical protein
LCFFCLSCPLQVIDETYYHAHTETNLGGTSKERKEGRKNKEEEEKLA